MDYMEIAILPKTSLRIKGKNASFVVDPEDGSAYDAAFLLGKTQEQVKAGEAVVIDGPGEYEVGGVKMTGTRGDGSVFYSLKIDGIDLVFGTLSALDSMHQKMKEHNIVVVFCDELKNSSFLTSLASNVIIFYGEKAQEAAQTFGKETVNKTPKYTTTKDKLPQEVETVVLE